MSYQKVVLDKMKTSIILRRLIAESDYSINQISSYLGLATSRVIYDWIKGIKLPSVENLYNLALILNIKMEDFLVFR